MKLSRLLAITIMLLNNEVVSAKELADKFEVSVRTIYRDIDAIAEAGIPVVSYQGSSGGFGIMEGFKIDKRLLGSYDIESITSVLKGVASIFDDKSYEETLDKLKGLSKEEKSIVMDFSNWGSTSNYKERLKLIKGAILDKKIIKFSYINIKGDSTNRDVYPITLVLKFNSWYIYGYCRLRKDFRLFKLSRIRNLSIKEESFGIDNSQIKKLEFSFEGSSNIELMDVELKFSKFSASKAMDFFFEEEVKVNEDGAITIKLYSQPKDQWLYSTILCFGKDVEVIKPKELRRIIKEKAKEIYNIYD